MGVISKAFHIEAVFFGGGGGGVSNPSNGLYGDAPPERDLTN